MSQPGERDQQESILDTFFHELPTEAPNLTAAQIKQANIDFLKVTLKVGADEDKIPLRKFMFYYEHVMPVAFQYQSQRLGGLVRSLFVKQPTKLAARLYTSEEEQDEDGQAIKKLRAENMSISTKSGKLYKNGESFWMGFKDILVEHEFRRSNKNEYTPGYLALIKNIGTKTMSYDTKKFEKAYDEFVERASKKPLSLNPDCGFVTKNEDRYYRVAWYIPGEATVVGKWEIGGGQALFVLTGKREPVPGIATRNFWEGEFISKVVIPPHVELVEKPSLQVAKGIYVLELPERKMAPTNNDPLQFTEVQKF